MAGDSEEVPTLEYDSGILKVKIFTTLLIIGIPTLWYGGESGKTIATIPCRYIFIIFIPLMLAGILKGINEMKNCKNKLMDLKINLIKL